MLAKNLIGVSDGDQRSLMNKPVPIQNEIVPLLQTSSCYYKEKTDGHPVFIWCNGKEADIKDIDGNLLWRKPAIGPKVWIQCEMVKENGISRFYFCDARIEGIFGTFDQRKTIIFRRYKGLGLIDNWKPFKGFVNDDLKYFSKQEGIVFQLKDVSEPVYAFKGSSIRTSFYAKNVYTIDLDRMMYEKMFGMGKWQGDSKIVEFTLAGEFVRERTDKQFPNTYLEIQAAQTGLSVIDIVGILVGDTYMGDYSFKDPTRLMMSLSDKSDDLGNEEAQSIVLSPARTREIQAKREKIVATFLIDVERKHHYRRVIHQIKGLVDNGSKEASTIEGLVLVPDGDDAYDHGDNSMSVGHSDSGDDTDLYENIMNTPNMDS
jgi:hypothetical protein